MKTASFIANCACIIFMSTFPIFNAAATSSQNECTTMVVQKPPQIPISFMMNSDTLNDLMAQNPAYIFFKVPDNATSTLSSASYSHLAMLALSLKKTTIDELSNASTGIILDSGKYIVLDTSQLSALINGSFTVTPQSMPKAIQWTNQLNVNQAAILDNEFVVLAFNSKNEAQTSSFTAAPSWRNKNHLKVLLKSQLYTS